MQITLKKVFLTSMIAVALVFTPYTNMHVNAEVTHSDIQEQRLVVMSELIDVLREHVTLLQLAFIDKLEVQVALLQAQIEKQNK